MSRGLRRGEGNPALVVGREGFRARALTEAWRYGDDPWVLVRELVQNARDAGASRVELATGCAGGVERLVCRDDGDGMRLTDAQRFLFTLYASSKHGEGRAGRFGVGFWSVLRFAPTCAIVRSRAAGEEGWEVRFDGELEPRLDVWNGPGTAGTEVVLERPQRGEPLGDPVRRAARRYVRFVTRRDDPRRTLEVTVDGERVSEPFRLPEPARAFVRGSIRGVVALGVEPRVELLCCGLLVRSTSLLEDLVPRSAATHPRRGLVGAGGVAPQVLLDDPGLEVLLARGDAREDRRLRRTVRIARGELRRLVRDQLDRVAPRSLPGRLVDWLRGRVSIRRAAAAVTAAGAVVMAGGLLQSLAGAGGSARPVPALAAYEGPRVDPEGGPPPPLALVYRPAREEAHFAVRRLQRGTAERLSPGWPAPQPGATVVEVSAVLEAVRGRVQLPLPTGATVVGGVAEVAGEPYQVLRSSYGDAVVTGLDEARVEVRFGTAAALEPAPAPLEAILPAELAARARELSRLPAEQRVARAEAMVAERVRYDRSQAARRRHAALRRSGLGDLAAALAAGAGDCDVQNGVLAELLGGAGLPARLALGYRGRDGRAVGELHAWVEVHLGGRWQVADATEHAQPTPPRGVGRSPRLPVALGGLGLLLIGAGVAALAAVRRGRRPLTGQAVQVELAELVRGALSRPGAFAGVPSLQGRPLVPLWGGRRVSLRELEHRRWSRRLLAASCPPGPVPAAVAVVDTRDVIGAAAASVADLVDVGDWWRRLEQGREDRFTDALEVLARGVGERWLVRWVRGATRIDVLALGRGRRWVLVGEDAPEHHGVADVAGGGAAEGALCLARAVVNAGNLPGPLRHRLLCQAARAAVREVGA